MAVAWHVSRLPLLPLASVKPLLAAPRLALLPSFSSCSTLSRPSLLSPPPSFLPSRPAIHFCSSFIRLLSGGGGQHRGRRLSSLNIRELYLFHSRCFRSSDSSPPSLRLAFSLPAKLSAAKFPLLFLLALFTLPTPLKRSPLCPLFLRFLLDKEQVVVVPFRKPPSSFHLSLRFRFLPFSSLSLVFPRFNR